MKKHYLYHPLTATPFKRNNVYQEIEPSEQLRPYIRCFWGTEKPYRVEIKTAEPEIIIPDTCVDIIYNINYTDNTVFGGFYGANDQSIYVQEGMPAGHMTSAFAIRFYPWGAYAYWGDSFHTTMGRMCEVGERFEWLDRYLRPKLLELKTLQEKIAYTEKLFTRRMQHVREKRIVNDAMNCILVNRGTLEISDLTKEIFVSGRQLERLFHEYMGITPKKLSNLIRYQFLWRDIVYDLNFHILDAVHKYAYADQSHLLREFKKYHAMDINSARSLAFKDVENVQDIRNQDSI